MKKVRKIVWQLLNHVHLGGAVQLMLESALTENGWFRSYYTKQSVDKQGNPIPWCTYPFIHFIEPRLTKEMNVFEFGCGNSTIWYANRVRSIKAVEHDEAWVKLVQPKLPANAQVIFQGLEGSTYANEVKRNGQKFHIVIIDGRQRNQSALQAMESLTEEGIIVWDNSDREQYQSTIQLLIKSGFKRIDFWGMCPVVSHLTCTSIFYKTNNCLLL
jgi:precorrin-6B methylase 2